MVTLRARKPKQEDPLSTPPVSKTKKASAKVSKPATAKKHHTTKKTKDDSLTSNNDESTESSAAAAPTDGVLSEFLTTRVDDSSKHDAVTWLYDTIRSIAPDLEPELQGKATLAFGGFDYQTKSKCSGRWSRISIMVNKTGLSLMVSGTTKDGKYLLEHYDKKQIGKKISLGKSCLRFGNLDDLDKDVLKTIIAEAAVADISSLAV